MGEEHEDERHADELSPAGREGQQQHGLQVLGASDAAEAQHREEHGEDGDEVIHHVDRREGGLRG
eukprot:3122832-Prymnesium_polylepis.1